MKLRLLCVMLMLVSLIAPARADQPYPAATPASSVPIALTSDTFTVGAPLPQSAAFSSCGGNDRSPDLHWTGAPAATKSFVVTLYDPNAPTGVGFWHWIAFNIPPNARSLAAGAGNAAVHFGKFGYTDFGFSHYGGPCPPKGDLPHPYIFRIYSLDVPQLATASGGTTGAYLMFLMRGHILAEGRLVGRYQIK